ncbi:MAG TPA: ATP-binding protein [Pseudonocardia sp.]|nr:ATP-binding protein [Pseudonocardia sp.]
MSSETGDAPAAAGAAGAVDLGGADSADHRALLHSGTDDLVARAVPVLRPALDAGHPVLAVVGPECAAALREALGGAADGIETADPARVFDAPAFTVAVRLARSGRRVRGTGGRTVVLGEHHDGLPGGPAHWARVHIALNVAVHGLPLTVICAYDEHSTEIERARETHPEVVDRDGTALTTRYRAPHEAIADYPPPPPADLGRPTVEMAFGPPELPRLRHLVATVARDAGLGDERVADVVLAVNELASNTVEHGPGTGRLRIWAGGDHRDATIAEITDSGCCDLPFPGLVTPPPDNVRGRGLWLARELTDVMEVWSDAAGTRIRLHAS